MFRNYFEACDIPHASFPFLQIMACGLSHALDTLGGCGGGTPRMLNPELFEIFYSLPNILLLVVECWGPRVWNNLLGKNLKSITSLNLFKKSIKPLLLGLIKHACKIRNNVQKLFHVISR